MELTRAPMIKVYSRGTRLSTGSSPRSRILLAQQNSSDEEAEDSARGRANLATTRIEGDLNWANKYLQSDRSSSIPRGQSRGSVGGGSSSTEDLLKTYSPASGKSNGLHLDGSIGYGARNRRSISPMRKFREDLEVSNGGQLRSTRASASPGSSRKDFTSRSNGRLAVNLGSRPPSGSVSPSISHPTTRTYNDLDRRMVTPGNPPPSCAVGYDRRTTTKTPISGTRKKLRSVLCRSRNDPHYFDED